MKWQLAVFIVILLLQSSFSKKIHENEAEGKQPVKDGAKLETPVKAEQKLTVVADPNNNLLKASLR